MKFVPVLAATATLFTTTNAMKNPFEQDITASMGNKHAMRSLASLAAKVTNPEYVNSLLQDKSIDLMSYDTASFGKTSPYETFGNGRRQLVSEDECGLFLAASLAQDVWNCFDLASELMSLVTEVNCVDVYDFSDRKIDAICTNKCHNTLTGVFKTMSQAGCSGAILKQGCSECADSEVCVDDSCRPYCVTDSDCSCDDVCHFGACTAPSTSDVETTDLGINGYKVTLEYICSSSDERVNEEVVVGEEPVEEDRSYCFSDMYNLMNDVDANTFCPDMQALGCCVGTVFDFMTNCATSNDTITTDVGTISVSDLETFCPDVDFKTSCATAPKLEENSCAEGYFLESSAAQIRFSIFAGVVAMMAVAFTA